MLTIFDFKRSEVAHQDKPNFSIVRKKAVKKILLENEARFSKFQFIEN